MIAPRTSSKFPDRTFLVGIKVPNDEILTKEVLITGGGLLVDLPLLIQLALKQQHDIDIAEIIYILTKDLS